MAPMSLRLSVCGVAYGDIFFIAAFGGEALCADLVVFLPPLKGEGDREAVEGSGTNDSVL